MLFSECSKTTINFGFREDGIANANDPGINIQFRLGDPDEPDFLIFHPLHPYRRALPKHRRPMPNIEKKDPSRIQMACGVGKCVDEVEIARLIAHDVEEGNHRVKDAVKFDSFYVTFLAIEASADVRRGGSSAARFSYHRFASFDSKNIKTAPSQE